MQSVISASLSKVLCRAVRKNKLSCVTQVVKRMTIQSINRLTNQGNNTWGCDTIGISPLTLFDV